MDIKKFLNSQMFRTAAFGIFTFILGSISNLLFYDQFMIPVNWVKSAFSPFEVNMPSGSEVTWGDKIIINAKHPDDVEYIAYNWDKDNPIKQYNAVVEVEFPDKIGEHVLNFYLVNKQGKHKSDSSRSYYFNEILNAPRLLLQPEKDQFYPFETIAIKAIDKDGIHHIGYAWDNEHTTPVYEDSANIQVPDVLGPHLLHYYAKDDSQGYNFTEWKYLKINVIPLPEVEN